MTLTVSDYTEWRTAARQLLASEVPPGAVGWLPTSNALPFEATALPTPSSNAPRVRVSRAFVDLAGEVSLHRSQRKWDLLYRLLWRLSQEGRHILAHATDDDVRAATAMAAQVRRDEHRMRAFARVTPVADGDETRFVAWYQPDHLIVKRAASFLVDRFNGMRWSILTPDLSAHWSGTDLTFGEGVETPGDGTEADQTAELWRTYYSAVFNPARVNQRAMQRDMPERRWRRFPEASVIPDLIATASDRAARLPSSQTALGARPFIPDVRSIDLLRAGAPQCRGCRLHEAATQVVFGEGPPEARIVLVGEQPGDSEDVAGRPFVGPAGQVLTRALAAAGIDREGVYLTNAVKHFSFEPRGKRRIHKTPRPGEMQACRPWLEAELQAIRPDLVVALGATAARALLGPQARVMSLRGRMISGLAWADHVMVTIHPSAVLRSLDEGERYFQLLVEDLGLAAAAIRDVAVR